MSSQPEADTYWLAVSKREVELQVDLPPTFLKQSSFHPGLISFHKHHLVWYIMTGSGSSLAQQQQTKGSSCTWWSGWPESDARRTFQKPQMKLWSVRRVKVQHTQQPTWCSGFLGWETSYFLFWYGPYLNNHPELRSHLLQPSNTADEGTKTKGEVCPCASDMLGPRRPS